MLFRSPEAITWHFAGSWLHMKSLVHSSPIPLDERFPKSKGLLERSVSIPIFVNMDKDIPEKSFNALKKLF